MRPQFAIIGAGPAMLRDEIATLPSVTLLFQIEAVTIVAQADHTELLSETADCANPQKCFRFRNYYSPTAARSITRSAMGLAC